MNVVLWNRGPKSDCSIGLGATRWSRLLFRQTSLTAVEESALLALNRLSIVWWPTWSGVISSLLVAARRSFAVSARRFGNAARAVTASGPRDHKHCVTIYEAIATKTDTKASILPNTRSSEFNGSGVARATARNLPAPARRRRFEFFINNRLNTLFFNFCKQSFTLSFCLHLIKFSFVCFLVLI